MAHAASGAVTIRLISLSNSDEWAAAVAAVPHGPAHTRWYNAALAASTEDEIELVEYVDGSDRAVCPIALRRFGDVVDLATPYGFGGFATRGPCAGLPAAFHAFAVAQGWVCGYLALNPLFPHPFAIQDGLEAGRTIYVLDLARSTEELFEALHDTHRYEIRKQLQFMEAVTSDSERLANALPTLYAETLVRTRASPVYRFSDKTLNAWLASPNCLGLGLGEPLQAVLICFYTAETADYFINASSERGRTHTRLLLWAAMGELKRREVRFFNLGGGAHEGDSLDAFKRRFGGRPVSIPVIKQVYDRDMFEALCARAGASARSNAFFPPYRAT